MLKIQNTAYYKPSGVKILIYGKPGTGKTPLCLTADNVFLLSSDPGLLTIRGHNIPYFATMTRKDIIDAHEWVMKSTEARRYSTIVNDSISEQSEIVLTHHSERNKDIRKAYQEYMKDIYKVVRESVTLSNKNFCFIAKRTQKEVLPDIIRIGQKERYIYVPAMPSEKSQDWLLHKFDIILAARQTPDRLYNYLQAKGVDNYYLRDRSGTLNAIEEPHLQKIIDKINGRV